MFVLEFTEMPAGPLPTFTVLIIEFVSPSITETVPD